jgi:hypothetical protein
MNFWECIIDAANETETGTPGASTVPTLTEYIRWGRKAQDIIADSTGAIEKLITRSTVARQSEYSMPAEFIRPAHIEWVQATSSINILTEKDIHEFRRMQAYSYATGDPTYSSLWDGKIYVYPFPSSSAKTTTLDGGLSAAATTIPVASTTGFAAFGRAVVDSEVFEYTNVTATSFTGCVRGVEGTTAATHLTGATVTERDLQIFSKCRYQTRELNVYTTGTCAFNLASATVTGTSTNFLANVFPGMLIGTGTNPSKWYTVSAVASDTSLTLTTTFGEANVSTTSYVACTDIDLPAENSDLLTLYMIMKTKRRMELYDQAVVMERDWREQVTGLRAAMNDRTDQGYPVMRDSQEWG